MTDKDQTSNYHQDEPPTLPPSSKGEQIRPPESTHTTTGPSRQIGPYKLLQQIGEGGMGTVWMAEQEKPVRRRVALKLIKAGVADKQVIARFEAERQALAMMDHQHIAKVLDAGTTDEGTPYFVMELVQGLPITEYCDRHKLTPRERLDLFVPVCKAVQHAHQKGIIHRDLKPSNVLVCIYDGQPVPKVIDFGLAKALQHQTKLTDKTMFTEFGQVVGTVQYMSPEQAMLDTLDIDTRSDIYSLGVLLYELLAGSTPIDQETLKANALLQILEIIREKDPPRPSHRLSSSGGKLHTISERRRILPAKLQQILRGDLDWIVMKALDKDRTRRYATANDFAEDIQRYIDGDTVEARPPSVSYKLRKYVAKHRGLTATLATIATLLVVGITGISWFAIEARLQRDRADTSASAAVEQAQKARAAEKQAIEQKSLAQMALRETTETLAISDYFLARARWNEGRVGEARELLERIPKEHRGIEWHIDRRKYEGGYMTCYGHNASVNCVAFSPDGTRIISGSDDSTIRIWDAQTGSQICELKGHKGRVKSTAFSPDGAQIVSGCTDGTVKLWDAESGLELASLNGHEGRVSRVAFSPESERVLSVGSGEVKLSDSQSRALLCKLRAVDAAFSPNGKYLALVDDAGIRLWDPQSETEIRTMKAEIRKNFWSASHLAFSPDGTRIACKSDSTIRVWDLQSGLEVVTLRGNGLRVIDVAFSPDGRRIVTANERHTIQLWDARTGAEIATLRGHLHPRARNSHVYSVSFSPDGGRVVSESLDKTVKVWNVRSLRWSAAANPPGIIYLTGHTAPVLSVAYSPDGRQLVTGSADKTIRLWDVASGTEIRTLEGHSEGVYRVAFNLDGKQIISASQDGSVSIWDARRGDLIETLPYRHPVDTVGFGSDGPRIATIVLMANGNRGNTIELRDAKTGSIFHTLGQRNSVSLVAFSPDASRIGSVDIEGTVKIWDTLSGSEIRTLTYAGGISRFGGVAFCADGRQIVVGGPKNTLIIWDVETGTEIVELAGYRGGEVAFSSDGRRIFSAGSPNDIEPPIKVWDVRTGTELVEFDSCGGHMAVSPSGLSIAYEVGTLVALRNPIRGQEAIHFKGDQRRIDNVSIDPQGRRVAAASGSTIRLWDTHSRKQLYTLNEHREPVVGISFSPDSGQMYSRSRGGAESFVWDVTTGERLLQEPWEEIPVGVVSSDERWMVVHDDRDVLLVDRHFKDRAAERTLRESALRIDPIWHANQATQAESQLDWFGAVFHRAWVLNEGPRNAVAYKYLRDAFAEFQAFNSKLSEPIDLALYPIVESSLKLPQGTELSESDADRSNTETWNSVRFAGQADVDESDGKLMRLVCEKFPSSAYWNTLAVTEYRLGNFTAAIKAAESSIKSARAEKALDEDAAHPIDLATLCMSYFKLGNSEKANEYRNKLEESASLETWMNDRECKLFVDEVSELIDVKDKNGGPAGQSLE